MIGARELVVADGHSASRSSSSHLVEKKRERKDEKVERIDSASKHPQRGCKSRPPSTCASQLGFIFEKDSDGKEKDEKKKLWQSNQKRKRRSNLMKTPVSMNLQANVMNPSASSILDGEHFPSFFAVIYGIAATRNSESLSCPSSPPIPTRLTP